MVGKQGRRGWGWVRQSGRTTKRWQASYVHEVARHKAPHTFATKMEAERWLADERRLIDMEAWTPPAQRTAERKTKAITVGDYGDVWLTQRTSRGGQPLKPSTRAQYTRILADHIKPSLGAIPVKNLTPATVRAWHAATLPDKPVMRAHAYGLLHAICATAVTDGLLSANPCQIRRAMKAQRKREPVILEVAEVAKLAEVIRPERFRAFILVAAWCGLRLGEMLELRRKDVTAACDVITVARGFTHADKACHISTPKSGKGRAVVVPPHIRAELKTHMKIHVADDREALLWPPARGGCHVNDKVLREYVNTALDDIDATERRCHGR